MPAGGSLRAEVKEAKPLGSFPTQEGFSVHYIKLLAAA